MPELLAWRAAADPDRTAIEVHDVATLTFANWDAGADAVAASLRRRGVGRGDRVALMIGARDWTDFAVGYCGVQRAGAVAVPLSDRLAAPQVRYVLEHCAAVAVLVGTDNTPIGGVPADLLVATVAELAAGPRTPADSGAPEPGDLAQILYTSGTTGRPKGVGATHANLTDGAPTHPRRLRLAHSEKFLHAFAIGTNAAQTMLFNALQARPSALTLPTFTPLRFARLLESSGAGSVFLVPATAIELLDSGALAGRDLTGVHLIGSTAAPLPPAVAMRLTTAFPNAAVVNYYTSTEAAPAQTSMIFDPARTAAVGRTVDGSLMITDPAGQPLPRGAVGDVWLRSRHPRTYVGDEQATRATFRDGWVRMGDLGKLDADGYLYLLDRAGDVVKTGAFKVSTLEVEAALYEHPQVQAAAVVAIPHPVLGSTVAAVVVPRSDVSGTALTLPSVRRFLSARLADYQIPTRLAVVDDLPRNDGGKVLKRQLIARFDAGNHCGEARDHD